MQRVVLAVVVAVLMTSAPASAQLFPAAPKGPAAERVLLDTTVFVEPPDTPGLCMPLGAGQLTVTVRRASEPIEHRRTDFMLRGFQDDPGVNVAIPVNQQPVTVTTRVNGSYHYCWDIEMHAPETEGMSHAGRGAYAHTVDVRILHRPD